MTLSDELSDGSECGAPPDTELFKRVGTLLLSLTAAREALESTKRRVDSPRHPPSTEVISTWLAEHGRTHPKEAAKARTFRHVLQRAATLLGQRQPRHRLSDISLLSEVHHDDVFDDAPSEMNVADTVTEELSISPSTIKSTSEDFNDSSAYSVGDGQVVCQSHMGRSKALQLLQHGQFVFQEKLERTRRANPKQEKELADLLITWKEEIIPKWKQKKGTKRVRTLLSNEGIPAALRAEVWTLLVGNPLHLTPELFEIMVSKSTMAKTVTSSGRASPPMGKEGTAELITTDLERTFPVLSEVFEDTQGAYELREAFEKSLHMVLNAYVSYRPDVGYVQGMSYLAAILLLHMDPYTTFVTLNSIMSNDHFFRIYRLETDYIGKFVKVFQRVLLDNLPSISRHFESLDVTADMYLTNWMMTMFSQTFPLAIICRLWDNFFLEGEVFILRVALALLKMFQGELEKQTFEEVLPFLKKMHQDIDATALFVAIRSIKLSQSKYEQYLDERVSPL